MLHHADDGGIVDVVGASAHTEFRLVESDDGSDEFAINNENNNNRSAVIVREEAPPEKVSSPARTVDLSPTPTLTIIHPESDDVVGDGTQRARRGSLTDRTFQRVKSAIGRRKTPPASPARLPPKIGVRKTFIAGSRIKRLPGIMRRNTRSSAETSSVISPKRRNSEGDFAQVDELQSAFCSGVRSLKGRKYIDKSNEDTFIAIGDLFATVAADAPPSPPTSPRPQDIGKIGVFGVFDGHGGASCSAFVARSLPAAIANSGAWARLTSMGSTSTSNGDKMRSRNNAFVMSASNSPLRPSAAAEEDFHCLVKDVMQEAIVDAFQSTQARFEAFAGRHRDDSGSTAVVAMVWQGWVVIANLGDSGALFHNDQMFVELGGSYTARTEVCTTVVYHGTTYCCFTIRAMLDVYVYCTAYYIRERTLSEVMQAV